MTTHNPDLDQVDDLDGVDDVDAQKRILQKLFPGWTIIHTRDTHRWWATRGPLAREILNRPADLDADTARGLYRQLAEFDRSTP